MHAADYHANEKRNRSERELSYTNIGERRGSERAGGGVGVGGGIMKTINRNAALEKYRGPRDVE